MVCCTRLPDCVLYSLVGLTGNDRQYWNLHVWLTSPKCTGEKRTAPCPMGKYGIHVRVGPEYRYIIVSCHTDQNISTCQYCTSYWQKSRVYIYTYEIMYFSWRPPYLWISYVGHTCRLLWRSGWCGGCGEGGCPWGDPWVRRNYLFALQNCKTVTPAIFLAWSATMCFSTKPLRELS